MPAKRALSPLVAWLAFAWLLVNIFDLLVTCWAVGLGRGYEANPFMARLLEVPPLAVGFKLGLAGLVVWVADRIERRTPFSGAWPLLAATLYLLWVCSSNVVVLMGGESSFLHHYPLAGGGR